MYIYIWICLWKNGFHPVWCICFPVSNWNRKHMIWVRFTLMGMSKSFPKTMVWKNHLNMAIFGVCMLNHMLGGMDSEEPDGKEFRDMPLYFKIELACDSSGFLLIVTNCKNILHLQWQLFLQNFSAESKRKQTNLGEYSLLHCYTSSGTQYLGFFWWIPCFFVSAIAVCPIHVIHSCFSKASFLAPGDGLKPTWASGNKSVGKKDAYAGFVYECTCH